MIKSTLIAVVTTAGLFAGAGTAVSSPAGLSLEQALNFDTPLVQKVHNCHADMRFNYVPEVGDDVLHRHSGSCRPVIADSGGGHCHSDGRRHRHRGYGTVTHNHYGRSCQVDVWRERRNPGNARGCVKVGPVTFCP